MSVIAKANARKLIKDYCINNPEELSLMEITYGERLIVENKPIKNANGRILFDQESAIITLSTDIKDHGHARFVLAHELGHFFNDRKIKNKFTCGPKELSAFTPYYTIEYNANVFAAELIMHENWFVEFVKGKRLNTQLLSDIANYFRTSLSSAAIRYAELGSTPTAIVFSKDGIIKWSSINSYFPFNFIQNGKPVNDLSYANELYKGNEVPQNAEVILADAWFLNDNNFKKDFFLMEQNIPMPNYNAVLTIMWEK